MPTTKHKCENCRKVFERPSSTKGALRFCSRACYMQRDHKLEPGAVEKRSAYIVKMHEKGYRISEIAAHLGLTHPRVKAIYDKAKEATK